MQSINSRSWSVVVAILVLGIAGVVVLWQQVGHKTSAKAIGTAKVYNGQAFVTRESKEQPLKNASGVRIGDVIRTAENTRLALELTDGSIVRLEAGSTVTIRDAVFNEQHTITSVHIELLQGKLWNRVEPLNTGATYQTETPVMVAAVRGTQYNLEHFGLRSVLSVFSGEVFGSYTGGNEQTVTPGHIFIVDKSSMAVSTTGPRTFLPGEVDDWIEFNLTEDKKLNSSNKTEPTNAEPTNTSASPEDGSSNPEVTNPAKPAPTSIPVAKPKTLNITATKTVLAVEETILFTAEMVYDDGTKQQLTTGITWNQTNEIGTFQNNYYRGILAGSTFVTGTFNGLQSNGVTLQVNSGQQPTTTLSVACVKRQNPNNPNGLPQALCTAYIQPGQQNVTTVALWQVSGSSAGSMTGATYTPELAGSATVTAIYNGVSGETTVKIP